MPGREIRTPLYSFIFKKRITNYVLEKGERKGKVRNEH